MGYLEIHCFQVEEITSKEEGSIRQRGLKWK
jgi:hypothetical protein